MDRTQTGHVLGDPRKREGVVASERDMSPAVLILIRLLTHLALLLGATKDPQVCILCIQKGEFYVFTTTQFYLKAVSRWKWMKGHRCT